MIHSRGSIGAGATGESGTGKALHTERVETLQAARLWRSLRSTDAIAIYSLMNANVRKVIPAQPSGVKTHQLRVCHAVDFARISLLLPTTRLLPVSMQMYSQVQKELADLEQPRQLKN